MTKIERLLWGKDKQPDMRDIVAIICTLATAGFYVQYFINGKEPGEAFLIITISSAIGSLCSKYLKPNGHTNGSKV